MERMPHIQLTEEQAVKYALLPGAPERIDTIAKLLDEVEALAYNREFRSIKGKYHGVEVMAVSTGIGGPSTAIAVEECAKLGVKAMIRVGSCGALQSNMRVGDLVLVTGALRNDGTSRAYMEQGFPAIPNYELLRSCEESAAEQKFSHHMGITRSHDQIYCEQKEALYEKWSKKGVMASDMETAALFMIGQLRGVKTASILNVVAEYQRSTEDGINQYVNGDKDSLDGEQKELITALEAFVKMERRMNENEINI
ncbi:N-Ribosylnicotinamide phosphorylase [Lachnospiraceae bacterium KM106-2]|nr:N-Ribosylnicotinamide phosphorylase [Lachnospiraceae bacterium KM106-2]